MRILLDRGNPADAGSEGIDDEQLATAYATPSGHESWLRVNMVSTVDGAAAGDDDSSGSINNDADHRVFGVLRSLADVVVVGAGTAASEGYEPGDVPIVLVSRRGQVPDALRGAPPGSVLLATAGAAEGLDEARSLLGDEHVWVLGSHSVDLVQLRERLVAEGFATILAEGGPHLLRDLIANGVADELCATLVPRVVAGDHPRIAAGPPVDAQLELRLLLEADSTLLGRWFVQR